MSTSRSLSDWKASSPIRPSRKRERDADPTGSSGTREPGKKARQIVDRVGQIAALPPGDRRSDPTQNGSALQAPHSDASAARSSVPSKAELEREALVIECHRRTLELEPASYRDRVLALYLESCPTRKALELHEAVRALLENTVEAPLTADQFPVLRGAPLRSVADAVDGLLKAGVRRSNARLLDLSSWMNAGVFGKKVDAAAWVRWVEVALVSATRPERDINFPALVRTVLTHPIKRATPPLLQKIADWTNDTADHPTLASDAFLLLRNSYDEGWSWNNDSDLIVTLARLQPVEVGILLRHMVGRSDHDAGLRTAIRHHVWTADLAQVDRMFMACVLAAQAAAAGDDAFDFGTHGDEAAQHDASLGATGFIDPTVFFGRGADFAISMLKRLVQVPETRSNPRLPDAYITMAMALPDSDPKRYEIVAILAEANLLDLEIMSLVRLSAERVLRQDAPAEQGRRVMIATHIVSMYTGWITAQESAISMAPGASKGELRTRLAQSAALVKEDLSKEVALRPVALQKPLWTSFEELGRKWPVPASTSDAGRDEVGPLDAAEPASRE